MNTKPSHPLGSSIAALLVLALSFSSFLALPKRTEAATLSFSPATVRVTEGQRFSVAVRVVPQQSKGYTVKATIQFPPDMLSMQGWSFAPDWMTLRKPGYDYFSASEGKMIRTAGYTNGFSQVTTFGTVTFVAKKTGTAQIKFSGDSMVLDDTSKNVYAGGNVSTIQIGARPANVPVPEPVEDAIPTYLLDIYLDMEQNLVTSVDQIEPKVVFSNFGRLPVSMEVTFDVLDRTGRVVASDVATTTIETESVLSKKFEGVMLPEGNYLLRVTTVYGGGITDEFDRIFTIKQPDTAGFPYWIIALAALAVLLFLIAFKRRRDEEDRRRRTIR